MELAARQAGARLENLLAVGIPSRAMELAVREAGARLPGLEPADG